VRWGEENDGYVLGPEARALAECDRLVAPPYGKFYGVAADGCAECDLRAGPPS